MSTVAVERLEFGFAPSVAPFQYERRGQNVHAWLPGASVVDVVAHDTRAAEIAWYIEAKDYRVITTPPEPSKLAELPETIRKKVQGTLDSLPVVAAASADPAAASHARRVLDAHTRRVVLHLEPHPPDGAHRALFAGLEANVLPRRKQLLREVDPDPLVLNIARTPRAGVPWTVR